MKPKRRRWKKERGKLRKKVNKLEIKKYKIVKQNKNDKGEIEKTNERRRKGNELINSRKE